MNILQKKKLLKFSRGCLIDKKLWFFANRYNALCYLDQEDFSVIFVTSIPNEETVDGVLYNNIEQYDNKLVLIPSNAKEIAIYDLLNGNITKIPLKENANVLRKFCESILINNCIYMIPRNYPAIVELNMITYEAKYYAGWIKKFQTYGGRNFAFFRRGIVRTERGFAVVSPSADVVMEFDVMCGCSFFYSYLPEKGSYSCIAKKDNTYLLADSRNNGIVIKKNLKDDGGKIVKLPDEFEKQKFIFFVVTNKLIYLVPNGINKMICVDVNREEVFTVQGSDDSGSYKYVWLYKNQLHAFNDKHMSVDVYDMEGIFIRKVMIHIPDNTIWQMYLNHIKEQRIVYEGLFGIDELIRYIEGNIRGV